LATIEKVLSIKFPFIRDLGIGSNPFKNFFYLLLVRKWSHKQRDWTVRNNIKTDSKKRYDSYSLNSNFFFVFGRIE